MVHSPQRGYQSGMRVLAALLLLISVLTTHAVALERASMKALGVPAAAPIAMSIGLDNMVAPEAADIDPAAESATDSSAKPCMTKGECVFLLSMYRFEVHTLVPVHGTERHSYPRSHDGGGVERPPIS